MHKLKYIFFQLVKYAHEIYIYIFSLFLNDFLEVKNFSHSIHELTSYSKWQCHLKLVLIVRYFLTIYMYRM